ncbi:RTA-like protein [Mycena crocata]|nr:RTA-like protein [Mycena crocata]
MAVGFVFRLIYAEDPDNSSASLATGATIAKYIIMSMFILLSPCLYLALDYMLFARLAAVFDKEVSERCLLIPSSRIVRIFLWSDVVTFSFQSTGGGFVAGDNLTLINLGQKLTMVGLVLQAISFLLFTVLLVIFGWRGYTEFPSAWRPHNARPLKVLSRKAIDDWRPLFYVICATCVGILVRSIFRIAEYAQGTDGYLTTHEGYFYLFDALPLWIAMTLFCFVWPVRVLNAHPGSSGMELLSINQIP